MKKMIVTLAAVLCAGLALLAIAFAKPVEDTVCNEVPAGREQNFNVTERGDSHTVKQEALRQAQFSSDLIPAYPVNWLTSSASVEITATCDGKTRKAVGSNNDLSAEQKSILHTVDLGATVVVEAKYKYKDGWRVHHYIGNYDDQMRFALMVVPETEAEYEGGSGQMKKYLQENTFRKLPERGLRKTLQAVVRFTVNEAGDVVDVEISETSGDPLTDQVLVDGISKMPKWKPAENAQGEKVKQDFEFSIGNRGC